MKNKILVIEDDRAISELLCMNLEAAGYETVTAYDGEEAQRLLLWHEDADMAETETTPNVVTKYLGQFFYEVLEPAGIEYRTKRTGQSRLIKFIRHDGGDANDGANDI